MYIAHNWNGDKEKSCDRYIQLSKGNIEQNTHNSNLDGFTMGVSCFS
jgi:hypothetical protein